MANINVSPDLLRTRAGQYEAESENVGEMIERLDSLLNELVEEWKGSASEAYAEKYEELKPDFVHAKDLLHDIAEALKITADNLENIDSEIASQFKA